MSDARPPKGLTDLLTWFRAEWEAEIPDALHVRGVWHDSEASSALGAPALAPDFSSYMMGSPYATDYDPRLDTWTRGSVRLRPMHAVLAEMAGGDPASDAAFRARWLFRLACMAWDIDAAAADVMPPQVARTYTRNALSWAWIRWDQRKRRESEEAA